MKRVLIFLLMFVCFPSLSNDFDFTINGDKWRIGINKQAEIIFLAKFDASTLSYPWILNPDYSYNPSNLTAEQYFREFIVAVNVRLSQEYDNTIPPQPVNFDDALDYMIKYRISFNELNKEIEVIN